MPAYRPDLNPVDLAYTRLRLTLRPGGHRAVPTSVTYLESIARPFRPSRCAADIRHGGRTVAHGTATGSELPPWEQHHGLTDAAHAPSDRLGGRVNVHIGHEG